MEILLLLAVIFLTIVQLVLGVTFILVFAKFFGVDMTMSFRNKKDDITEIDETTPIEEFKPDFSRPLKVKINGEPVDTDDRVTPLE